jgi:hypothetical protein
LQRQLLLDADGMRITRQHQVQRRLLLNVVVSQSATALKLLTREDQALRWSGVE